MTASDAERLLGMDTVFECHRHRGHCYFGGWKDADGELAHLPYLGWTCGGCWRSSSTPGEPLLFSAHKCSNVIGFGNALFALLVAVGVAVVVWSLAR